MCALKLTQESEEKIV